MSRKRRYDDSAHLAKAAKAAGCIVVQSRSNNHYKVYLPNGKRLIMSCTPSDGRATLNAAAQLRREGVNV